MPTLKLPDGSVRKAPPAPGRADVAESIGKHLAKDAIAAKVDGAVVDLDREFPAGAGEVSFAVLTPKDPEALEVLRHGSAHIMARAVMRLFPGTQLAFGRPLENGFYYDIDSPTPIAEDEDFPRIEAEMKKIVAGAEPFEHFERPTPEGRELRRPGPGVQGRTHRRRPEGNTPPSASTARANSSICAADRIFRTPARSARSSCSASPAPTGRTTASRKQLQRLYATAFFNQKDLDAYLHQVEEAKKRDHRVLGKQLKLFTISQQVGSGLILWMPKGAIVRSLLESFIKDELLKRGYQPVYTPHIGRLGAVSHQRAFPVLPRRPVSAIVSQSAGSTSRYLAHPAETENPAFAGEGLSQPLRSLSLLARRRLSNTSRRGDIPGNRCDSNP